MKIPGLMFVVLTLAACATEPKQHGSTESMAGSPRADVREVDLSSLAGKEVDLQTFLKLCAKECSKSFTYDAGTSRILERTYMTWSGKTRMSTAELEPLLGQVLSVHGLELKPVGPAELHVFSVERVAK